MSTTLIAPTQASPHSSTGMHPPLYRLSVAKYHAMIDHGILTARDRVELIYGWLVQKMTNHPPHASSTDLVQDALRLVLPSGWTARSPLPITLASSEPEPDACVARGKPRDYAKRHPGPADIALVVEISDSSLDFNRNVKKPMYAEAGIPVYWIVNLVDNVLEVYSAPSGPASTPDYATQRTLHPADEVVLVGQVVGRIPVRDLLP